MPVKKTEAQKQADKSKKKEQLKLKKEQKQKELYDKYKNNRFVGSITFNVPDVVKYDKNGSLKLINPLTKSNNIKKINKKQVIKLVKTNDKSPSYQDDRKLTPEGVLLLNKYNKNSIIREITSKKIDSINKKFNEKTENMSKKNKEYIKLLNEKNNNIDDIKKAGTERYVKYPTFGY